MKMSLCLEPLFPTENMAEKISRLSSLGFKHFEFWSSEDKDWEWLHRHRDEFSVQLFSAQREHTCYIENHQNKYIDEIIGNIKKAKKINCHKLMLLMDPLEKNGHVKEPHSEISWDIKVKNSIETLRKVAYLGLKNQVEFVFEPLNTIKDHPGYSVNSTEKAIQILEGVDSPCMKLLFDAYHMSMMGEDIYQTTKKYNHWIGHIHLANPPHRSGPESEGDIDFVQFFKHLKNIDYQGTIGWEFFPEKSSQDAALAIKKIMEEQCQWINWNHLKK